MELMVLGPLQVRVGTDLVDVPGAKERVLLARLIAAAGRTVTVPELIDALWGDDPPRSAAKSLQTYVLRVRNVLEPGREGVPRLLLTEGSGYRLAVPADAVDAHRFARLVALARHALDGGRSDAATTALDEAFSLWRGPAYAGIEDRDFAIGERRRLEELRLVALEDRCDAMLRCGDARSVVPELDQLVQAHPFRERLWALLVHALYRTGRQADALGAYDRARRLLQDELGVDPGPVLREAHARVLAQDPALADDAARLDVPAPLVAPRGPFVEREAELATLRALWQAVADDGTERSRVVLVRGPRGAGATRLAAALAEEVARSGAPVVLAGEAADAGTPSSPHLVVARGLRPDVVAAQGLDLRGRRLLLALAPADAAAPTGAAVIDLRPLSREGVQAIVGSYVEPDCVGEATDHVLRQSDGWPGRVHDEAVAWVRRSVGAHVQAAAHRAGTSADDLAAARSEVSAGVLALREITDRRVTTGAVCPWRGLASYDVADAPFFVGRERLVAELVARLAAGRVVGVVGASGSGKSSLVRAGLLASLADGVLPGSDEWAQVVLRPGEHPMRGLARAALGAAAAPEEPGAILERLLAPDRDARRLVLVVDQLEELWTLDSDVGERAAFLEVLAELVTDPRSAVTLVLVVRADYVSQITESATLAAALSDATVLVGPMTQEELRRAVEVPADRAALVLDPGLADSLVRDAGAEPGALPLLSTALVRLWELRSGHRLSLIDYVAGGGLSAAIARLAEDAYAALSEAEREVARVVLLRLAGPAPVGPGEVGGIARRRVPVAELEALPGAPVRPVVERLTAARLVSTSDGFVEVAHEALFREWPRLRGWLSDDGTRRDLLRRLSRDAGQWVSDGRDPGLLWRGARLLAGIDAADTHPDEVTPHEAQFLEAGRVAADAERRAAQEQARRTRRQNRRLRVLLGTVAVLLAGAVLSGGLALRSQDQAEQAAVSADARRLAAASLTEEDTDLALLTAVQGAQVQPGPETYGALLTLLARIPNAVTQVRTTERFLGGVASRDGATFYASENAPVVRALDATTGAQRWSVELPGQPRTIASSPDGESLMVTWSADARIHVSVLDPVTGAVRWSLPGEDGWTITSDGSNNGRRGGATWLPDGRIATGTADGLLLIDPRTHAVADVIPWTSPLVPTQVQAVSGDRVLVESEPFGEVPVTVVDLRRRTATATSFTGLIGAAAPDGERIVTAADGPVGTEVVIRETASLTAVAPPVPLDDVFFTAAWSPDATSVALGSDTDLLVLDSSTGQVRHRLSGHSGPVMGQGFVEPDGTRVWSAGRDGAAWLWDLSGRFGVTRTTTTELATYVGDVAADGRTAVAVTPSVSGPNPASIVDVVEGRPLGDPLPLPAGCRCQPHVVAITPDGRTALAGLDVFATAPGAELPQLDEGLLAGWDAATGALRYSVPLPWAVIGVDTTPDGRTAVVNGTGGWAVVDLTTGRVAATHPGAPVDTMDPVYAAAVAPDGDVAAIGRGDALLLVDAASGRELRRRRLPDDEYVLGLTWSPDGSTLAVGGMRGIARFFRAADLAEAAPPRRVVAGGILDWATSTEGAFAASLGTDGSVLIWDATTWRPLGQPVNLHSPAFAWLAFDPAARVLRTLDDAGRTVRWSLEPDEWVRAACRIAGRELTPDEWAVVRPGTDWQDTCDTPAR